MGMISNASKPSASWPTGINLYSMAEVALCERYAKSQGPEFAAEFKRLMKAKNVDAFFPGSPARAAAILTAWGHGHVVGRAVNCV